MGGIAEDTQMYALSDRTSQSAREHRSLLPSRDWQIELMAVTSHVIQMNTEHQIIRMY